MGSILSKLNFDFLSMRKKVEPMEVLEAEEVRRRNSLAAYISQFITYDGEDFTPLLTKVKEEKGLLKEGAGKALRVSKFGKIGDAVLYGDFHELRNQVFVEFRHINRHYPDQHSQNTLLHMLCQEGYAEMMDYLFNPLNRNKVDDNDVDVMAATGIKYGLDGNGNVLPPPQDDNNFATTNPSKGPKYWCAPGGPLHRERCVQLLLENGCHANAKDFQDFTALHYAAMWGWTKTMKVLMEHGGNINARTTAGRTPLMYAVEFEQEDCVVWLVHYMKSTYGIATTTHSSGGNSGNNGSGEGEGEGNNNKGETKSPYTLLSPSTSTPPLELNAVDMEGYSALILAVEKGENGYTMAKTLLQHGADPNILTIKRKSALKIACHSQTLTIVNLLLDYHVLRRKSAFNLLQDEGFNKIQTRLTEEDRKEEEAMKKAIQQEVQQSHQSGSTLRKKKAFEAWVEYRDKKTKKVFYYNTVTRKSQWEKPFGYLPDKNWLVRDVTFGMSFYH
eukprot:gene10314-11414_t